jgi:ornithine carbamoyltransferase
MAYAWMYGCAKMGIDFVGYGPRELISGADGEVMAACQKESNKSGAVIKLSDSVEDIAGADVIYSDIWASMGEEDLIPERAKLLSPYRVDDAMLRATGNPDVLFMHCLPSFHDFETKLAKEWKEKGVDIREVTDEVFRGRHSVVFDEAENRMHTIKAVMVATI